MITLNDQFIRSLRRHRADLILTKNDAAKLIGINRKTYVKIENGSKE
ncbi:helix-turn-helix domain-containing protein, partial [Enterococcus faecium]|nr:helix-turn-helix domain-containing protein [Enterococcus faecium]